MRRYFVSYKIGEKFGNAEVKHSKITSIDHINTISRYLQLELKSDEPVIILFYQEFT